MHKRESSCPLCGARMHPKELLNSTDGIISAELGVLSCHCPYCQGYLEIQVQQGELSLGYLNQSQTDFEVAMTLPFESLVVLSDGDGSKMVLKSPEQKWMFSLLDDDI